MPSRPSEPWRWEARRSRRQTGHATHAKAVNRTAEKVSSHDGDNVQSGDQTTPDVNTKASRAASSGETNTNSTGESTGTEADGPGGHQDPAGANVDHQFQGQE